jgi:hypothetical protein
MCLAAASRSCCFSWAAAVAALLLRDLALPAQAEHAVLAPAALLLRAVALPAPAVPCTLAIAALLLHTLALPDTTVHP